MNFVWFVKVENLLGVSLLNVGDSYHRIFPETIIMMVCVGTVTYTVGQTLSIFM